MSFAARRIKDDIENIVIPVRSVHLKGLTLDVAMEMDYKIYKGLYSFRVLFPDAYPFEGPRVYCLTPVFHPNIDAKGHVCLKILREGWRPSFTISSILVSILLIFECPSPEDALNTEAADLLEQDYRRFLACAADPRPLWKGTPLAPLVNDNPFITDINHSESKG